MIKCHLTFIAILKKKEIHHGGKKSTVLISVLNKGDVSVVNNLIDTDDE